MPEQPGPTGLDRPYPTPYILERSFGSKSDPLREIETYFREHPETGSFEFHMEGGDHPFPAPMARDFFPDRYASNSSVPLWWASVLSAAERGDLIAPSTMPYERLDFSRAE